MDQRPSLNWGIFGDTDSMTRREFLTASASVPLFRLVDLPGEPRAGEVRFAVITDLHHGLAPDAQSRLQAFVEEVKRRNRLDFVMQMGDFNYSQPSSAECTTLFNTLSQPKIHVLGNHDMDKCDKTAAMKFFGMPSRYGVHRFKGWRFVVLDLNHFKLNGSLYAYENGNYFTDGAQCNWADPEQLDWLEKELSSGPEPTILIAHQPLGFCELGQPMPAEQVAVLDVVERTRRTNPRGAVRASLFGHLHVDRLEHYQGVPFLCVNSASYFWYQGMHAYSRALFAFMTLSSKGLAVEGVAGSFVTPPPKASDVVIGRSASVSNRSLHLD